MPELPEVETVKRGLAPIMEGSRISHIELRRKNLRFPFPDNFAATLKDQKIVSLGRRAKYLLVDLENGMTIIMHLGMSGSFRIELEENSQIPGIFHHDRSKISTHDHVVIHLEHAMGKAKVVYNDPRRFGFMDLVTRAKLEEHSFFKALGVEPVGNVLSTDLLAKLLHNKAAPIKAALLDQRLIAGLGNIYVCEALHEAGISPKRKAGSLVSKSGKPLKKLAPLADIIRNVIAKAIEAGGSSLRDHRQADGNLGYFQHQFQVYDREGKGCRKLECGGTITRIVQSGRSSFYCPKCQR
jgi:formamidopyrimidine-DNA glycosylase